MKYPITASVILVQLDGEHDAVAYVGYGPEGERAKQVRVELKIGTLSDATDMTMWMQMAAASVCDAL